MPSKSRFTLTLLFLLAGVCVSAVGQTESATISGRITDQQEAVVAGADVSVTNIDTGTTTKSTTNRDGIYVIPGLKPARYRLTVVKNGFRTVNVSDITLNVQDSLSQNFKLQVGSISESVTVVADTAKVNTTDATVSTVVDRKFAQNLPLNGRSFQSLMTITPGVSLTTADAFDPGQFSVNGQRSNANYFLVDGVSANVGASATFSIGQGSAGTVPGFSASGATSNLVSIDALQEFKVQTSIYAPEFGRSPGAQVSVVTRSGTNQWHGTVFNYVRNDIFDANDWFAKQQGLPQPALRQNDFGGVLGGPIIKDGTFFFLSYEGLRLRLPAVGNSIVPSRTARQHAIMAMQPYIDAFPLPTGPEDPLTGTAPSAASYSNPSSSDSVSLRIDQKLPHGLLLFARYNYAPSSATARGGFFGTGMLSDLSGAHFNTQTFTTGLDWLISPSLANEFRFNYSRNSALSSDALDAFGGAIAPPDSAFFPSGLASPATSSFLLQVADLPLYSVGRTIANTQRQINLTDGFTMLHRKHEFKVGADYRRLFPKIEPFDYSQSIFFPDVFQFAAGQVSSIGVGTYISPMFPVFTNVSLYGQDTFRVAPHLTATYGIRWEYNPPPSESNGHLPFSVVNLDDPANLALARAGTPLYSTSKSKFAPRIGLAYEVVHNEKWTGVIRGGYGLFYDTGQGEAGNVFTGFPYLANKNLPPGTPFPLSAAEATPPPFSTSPPVALMYVSTPDLTLPRVHQFSLAWEQALGSPKQSLAVTYVGAIGHELLYTGQLINPNADFQDVLVTSNEGFSDYHGLQMQFQRRVAKGLQSIVSYTWSHSIDNASNATGGARGFASTPKQDRGNSDFDIRHQLNAALSYDLPFTTGNRAAAALLRGWGLDSLLTARSSTPVNVIVIADQGFGFQGYRPDLLPGVSIDLSDPRMGGGRVLNVAAFALPAQPGQGDLGRNSIRGFALAQWDLALRREVALGERVRLQFRAEAFNVLNHPNFTNPDPILGFGVGGMLFPNPTFGQSRSMLNHGLSGGSTTTPGNGFNPLYQVGGPRSLQLALKLLF